MGTKLRLIHGGFGMGPPKGGKRKKKKRPHWLVNLLWYAISRAYYSERANTVTEIADRMTALSPIVLGHYYQVTPQQANHCLGVVRKASLQYGFGIFHVEKGAAGSFRGYVPILVDLDQMHQPITLIDEDDVGYVVQGYVSSSLTTATMLRNQATVADLFAGLFDARFTAAAAEWRRAADQAEELVAFARTL